MAPNIYYNTSATLNSLSSLTILFVGYGNQGRAQALNLRDSLAAANPPLAPPPQIVIANRSDSYNATAVADGFEVTNDFVAAAARADVLFLLVPDQVQPKLFNEQIAPTLKKGCTVVVASGFNVFYGRLNVGQESDVVMVAPRMIGTSVRSLFVKGDGFPCFVSVEQDGSGKALDRTLALALGIGALKTGAVECSARDETLIDLFSEQALWPSIIVTFREAYATLKKLGCSDEAIVHELWLSKEAAEVFEKCADDGFIKQLRLHSSVSQYGQLSTSLNIDTEKSGMKKFFQEVAEKRILGGEFVKEFTEIDDSNGGDGIERKLQELYKLSSTSELAIGEAKVRERLGLDKA
jgi:ketol-acid reductoisomerase